MKARLIKEARDLLPTFAGTLLLMVVPFLLVPHLLREQRDFLEGFGYLALGLACVVMSGISFGGEFQHRTLSLLLSQPIARSVLWRDKMLVLGAGLVLSLVALLGCRAAYCPVREPGDWVALIFVPLCAFCGAPYWTLLLRQEIGGMAFAVAFPIWILILTDAVNGWLGQAQGSTEYPVCFVLLAAYCALLYWRGYARFKRLQAVDGSGRELSVPAGLEAIYMRQLTKVSSRFRGPFATLLKKELRLQQTCFLLAGVFVLIALVGAGLVLCRRDSPVGNTIIAGDLCLYVVILPLVAGAISIADERGWGMAEWHRTLPPSAVQQWSVKMLAALSTSLVLGLLLPVALVLVGVDQFRAKLPPPAGEACIWILVQLLVASTALYAASFSTSTLRAILGAFVLFSVVGAGASYLAGITADTVAPPLAQILVPLAGPWLRMPSAQMARLGIWVWCVVLGLMLGLMQWLSWHNFRRHQASAPRVWIQMTFIFVSFYLLVSTIVTMSFILETSGPIR